MKKICFTLLVLCLFFNQSILTAKIIETNEIESILDYAKPNTLLLFDIDNTLMEPVQELGNDQWFRYQLKKYLKEGLSESLALKKALSEWRSIRNITKMRLIEDEAARVVQTLQEGSYMTMGLTTQGLGLSTRTVEQLEELGIDFTAHSPSKWEHFFDNGGGVLFRGGILFTAGTNKGAALLHFLQLLDYRPEQIVFINDKASHIREVEVMCEREHIPFIGLRYGALDEKVANFRSDIAEIQYEQFGHIISDAEAEALLK